MGRGDKRTRRGKIFKGSYGNTRTHKIETATPSAANSKKPAAAPKKAPVSKKTK